jgi:peptidoglycan-associated lipoprotein
MRGGTRGQVSVVKKGVGMRERTGTTVLARVVFATVLALALGACANQGPKPDDARLGPGGLGSARGNAKPGTAQDFSQNVGDIVYFSTDSTDLSPEAQQTLANQARWLQQYAQYTITVEGHADERGTREYNLALGERRANSVRDYLVALGIGSSRITTISYGKERPVDPRSNEEAWAKNRRSVTQINPATGRLTN